MSRTVFFPQQHPGYPGTAQFSVDADPIRKPAARGRARLAPRKTAKAPDRHHREPVAKARSAQPVGLDKGRSQHWSCSGPERRQPAARSALGQTSIVKHRVSTACSVVKSASCTPLFKERRSILTLPTRPARDHVKSLPEIARNAQIALPFRHADQSFVNRQSLANGSNSCDHLCYTRASRRLWGGARSCIRFSALSTCLR